MSGFRQIDETLVHQGRVVSFREGTFEGPGGEVFRRDLVRHPGAVSVVAVDAGGTVVLVRQFRAAMGREMLEIPAGRLDVEGETLERCAARELEEEVGLRAERFDLLVSLAQSPGFCDEVNHIFLATGLQAVPSDNQGPEEVHMTVERVALASVPSLVAGGQLVDAKSIVGLLLARERLGGAA